MRQVVIMMSPKGRESHKWSFLKSLRAVIGIYTIIVSKRSAFGIAVAYTERTEGVEVGEATASCILHLDLS